MNTKLVCQIITGIAFTAVSVFAAENAEPSAYDKVWGATKLVNNKDAAILQKLELTGRLQGDAVSFHSDDDNYDDFDWRRFRIGFKATVFNDFIIHAEMDGDMNDVDEYEWNKFYGRLTDAYIGWKACEEATLKVGKQSAGFTLDGATSSKKLLTPERSIVAENIWFPTEYFTGAAVSGDVEGWSYKIGGFSASGEPEFGHFESGYFGLISAGYKVGDKGTLRLDYVYNDPDYTGTQKDSDYTVGTRDLEHIIALVYQQMLTEKLGIWSDITGAKGITDGASGKNQSDLVGIDIMPFYNLSEDLQLVLQYAGVSSLDDQSDVRLTRYAGKNANGVKVETSHNLLLGFNWYLYGHKLKWQNAIEYNYGKNLASTGDDYTGYGVTSALRISW